MATNFVNDFSRTLWELSKATGQTGLISLYLHVQYPERYPELAVEEGLER